MTDSHKTKKILIKDKNNHKNSFFPEYTENKESFMKTYNELYSDIYKKK